MENVENVENVNVCEVCGKETENTIRVKIELVVYNVCKECAKDNGYDEYDGSDYASDWN